MFSRLRISTKFMLSITPALILLLVGGCFVFDNYISKKLTASYHESVMTLSNSLYEAVKSSLERGQMDNFQRLLWKQREIKGIVDVSLFAKDGKLNMSSTSSAASEVGKASISQDFFSKSQSEKKQFTVHSGSNIFVVTPQITNADCIRCHHEWKLNELGGIVQLTYDLSGLSQSIHNQRMMLAYGCTGLVILVSFLLYFLTRTVTRPVIQMTETMRRLAENDLSVSIPGDNRHDEIGEMASAIHVFKNNAIDKDKLEKRLLTMADDFEENVGTILSSVLHDLSDIGISVSEVLQNADKTIKLSKEAVDSSEVTSSNVQSVASALEEMNTTNQDINIKVLEASSISTQAVSSIKNTSEIVSRLNQNAKEIEAVIGMISDIAEQTNLLALNATIEAARAGEAGKGFAVVSSEVKDLAFQTKASTIKISDQIRSIQSSTSESVNSIGSINLTLEKINEISKEIAIVVSQQQNASNEITQSTQTVASETSDVSRNLRDVVTATDETGKAARVVNEKIGALLKQTETLQENLSNFIAQIKTRS